MKSRNLSTEIPDLNWQMIPLLTKIACRCSWVHFRLKNCKSPWCQMSTQSTLPHEKEDASQSSHLNSSVTKSVQACQKNGDKQPSHAPFSLTTTRFIELHRLSTTPSTIPSLVTFQKAFHWQSVLTNWSHSLLHPQSLHLLKSTMP